MDRTTHNQQWPQVAIAMNLAQQLTRLEQEFGMTPAGRARLQIPATQLPPDSEKAAFIAAVMGKRLNGAAG